MRFSAWQETRSWRTAHWGEAPDLRKQIKGYDFSLAKIHNKIC
jgi:hypothetical protein